MTNRETRKATRIRPNYPGFDVDVINGDGQPVPGNTKLATVRDTYFEE